jgi:hypothetical protein
MTAARRKEKGHEGPSTALARKPAEPEQEQGTQQFPEITGGRVQNRIEPTARKPYAPALKASHGSPMPEPPVPVPPIPPVPPVPVPIPAPIAPVPTATEALAALLAEMREDQVAMRKEIVELRSLIAKPAPPSLVPAGYELLAKLAARLGYSDETVRLWCVKGAVRALRRGGVWCVHVESAEKYAHGK